MTPVNKLILSYPKSGTKLLSKIYNNQGYHDFGPFFDTFRYSIVETAPYPTAVKMSFQQQIQLRASRHQRGVSVDDWTHLLMTKHRLKKFNNLNVIHPSIITLQMPTFGYTPEAVDLFNDREVLCVRRKDRFAQLVSRCIEISNLTNPTGVKVDKAFFEFCFNTLLRLERLQTYCVESGKGRLINLEDLLDKKVDLGFEYSIVKETDPALLIQNIDEIQKVFADLVKSYNLNWEI